jgi:hypothetical protein
MLEIANACSCLGKAGSFSHCKSAGILQVFHENHHPDFNQILVHSVANSTVLVISFRIFCRIAV